jgi:hypothetical protein
MALTAPCSLPVRKMDIEGSVTALKSGIQMFKSTTHHLNDVFKKNLKKSSSF